MNGNDRVVLVPRGLAEVDRHLRELESRGGRVLRLRSADLMTERGIYETFAEVLGFPGYFGRNWDAMVDCLDDLCGAVTGGVGVTVVVDEADRLLEAEHFPLFVSVLCQAADRANSGVDLDGCPRDRPAVAQHFVFEFLDFEAEDIARRVAQPDLSVTVAAGTVGAALDPGVWHGR
ncbi:barstar family protein [Streptomyces cinnabarinus]|uniref:Barstar family protein n=1 Tax=Streptomyces cinnabarinus TaxID=67287 RepID=A0ABY7KH58_9ACTN|nr:barstar family protein [Streptomyces cinnabarinus]WAZ23393.1 barstar family protein [Streptomyces cinnabarinus]